MKITTWAVSAFLLAVLTFYAACAAPSMGLGVDVHAEGIPTPLGEVSGTASVRLGKVQNASGSYDTVNTKPGACVRLQHVGSDGSVTEVDIQADELGMGGAPTPAGTVRTNFVVMECPEEDASGKKAKKMYEPAQQPVLASRQVAGEVYEVYSVPAELQVFSGGTDVEYGMSVKARSLEDALAIAESIAPGSPIPAGVSIGYWRSYSPVEEGVVRMTAAQPGTFSAWTLNVNAGAHVADLWTNSVRYSADGWDVVETVIPTSALNFGVPGSGQSVDNQFITEHSASSLTLPVTSTVTYTFHY